MLSYACPSDPTCSSSKVSELGADELTLQKTDPEAGLGETQTLHFSIRDYVLASRRKNIGTNWPFPRRLLQLCLRHGIRDSLPPFDPPSSVRNHCLWHIAQASQAIRAGKTGLIDGDPNSTRTDSCLSSVDAIRRCSDRPDDLIHDDHSGIVGIIPSTKKCRLIVNSPVSRQEDMISASTVSEIMTPKICPVCKAFASTSNTTLNAHMDQCLSMESATTLVENKVQNPRVKPRKKRFMEDIYADAAHCSLEDLDKRNGSNWAKDSTLVDPVTENGDVCVVVKKLKSSQVHAGDDKAEGSVYVDSKGIKLRILSKLDDSPRVISETFGPTKSGKGVGDDGNFISVNKEIKLKLKNKKLSSSKMFKDKEALGVSFHEASHQEEGPTVQISGKKDQHHMGFASVTLQSWSCSKRSNLSKRNDHKDSHKSLENSTLVRPMPAVDLRKTAPSTASESSNSELVPGTVQSMSNQEKGSPRSSLNNVLVLKLPKPSMAVSTPSNIPCVRRRRRLKLRDSCGIGRTSTGTACFPPKTKRVSPFSEMNSNIEEIEKSKREVFSEGNVEQPRCGEPVLMECPTEEDVDQRLHPGRSLCQDTEPKDSEMQFEDKTPVTIITGSVTCATIEMEECVISVDKPGEQTSKLEHRDVESPSKATSAQEFSGSIANPQEPGSAFLRESSSIASQTSAPVRKSNLVFSREVFSSSSIASTISPASLIDSKCKASESKTVSTHKSLSLPLPYTITNEETQGIEVGSNQKDFAEKPQLQSEYQSCRCAWQSLTAGSMPNSKPKMYQNLHVWPVSSSSSSSSAANWSLRTDAANPQCLESPTGSTLTRACSEVGTTSPSCGTPTQSSSNSILRLMGKNLMVMHHEESAQLPKLNSPATDHSSSIQLLPSPPPSFAPYASASNHDTFPFAARGPAAPQTNVQSTHMNRTLSNGDIMRKDTLSPLPLSHTMFQRTFPCLSPDNHLLGRSNGFSPSHVEHPTLLPSPLLFRSPSATHLRPPFCYPQSLR